MPNSKKGAKGSDKKVQIVISGGGIENSIIAGSEQLMTPENVKTLIELITTTAGLTTAAIGALKLWIDDRKSRKIRIKCKDFELEFAGGISEEKIYEQLEVFKEFKEQVDEKGVKIIVTDK